MEIERIARKQIGQWFQRHREAVRIALGSLPHDWLHRDATQLVPEGTKTCPPSFTVKRDDLAAAMVLLALIDDKGPNLATIQSCTSDSVERASDDTGFVTAIKARNREVLRTPAPAGGLYSYGGLLEFVAAATRVDRMLRSGGTDFDRLLFVATGAITVLGRTGVNTWWWYERSWDGAGPERPETLSFQRLRKTALLRGQHRGHNLIGQKETTARLYLADALPDAILTPGLLNTQKSMADYWRSKYRAVAPAMTVDSAQSLSGAQAAEVVPLIQAEAVMDVGVAACISNGQSPQDDNKPCGLGPVACFVCPNGYRIPEIIPGLIATVQFTENIRKYEPQEWVTGEAPALNSLARKALGQFPRQFVEAVQAEEIANSRALIACVYTEGRRD
ncbi:hypothetical protein [Nesterenkonia sp. CF4.4]|uniref:hypothetical protein n=1 Tax=Nesterenkonia sp. CF4.4 TaxID=3373079 RepID=UPI003EE7483C